MMKSEKFDHPNDLTLPGTLRIARSSEGEGHSHGFLSNSAGREAGRSYARSASVSI
jgi:hypothetical protein